MWEIMFIIVIGVKRHGQQFSVGLRARVIWKDEKSEMISRTWQAEQSVQNVCKRFASQSGSSLVE